MWVSHLSLSDRHDQDTIAIGQVGAVLCHYGSYGAPKGRIMPKWQIRKSRLLLLAFSNYRSNNILVDMRSVRACWYASCLLYERRNQGRTMGLHSRKRLCC